MHSEWDLGWVWIELSQVSELDLTRLDEIIHININNKKNHIFLIKITVTELTLLMIIITDWILNSWRSEI